MAREKDAADREPTIHVESHNQQGGITAHTVNVSAAQRQLKSVDTFVGEIQPYAGTTVTVARIHGNAEVEKLAVTLVAAIERAGWTVTSFNSVISSGVQWGVFVRAPGNTIDEFSPAMRQLGQSLLNQGIDTIAQTHHELELYIGMNPKH